jgi:hypothetical protein
MVIAIGLGQRAQRFRAAQLMIDCSQTVNDASLVSAACSSRSPFFVHDRFMPRKRERALVAVDPHHLMAVVADEM